ncbi:hypothetical protein PVAG01_07708 [Phlyctema vagabunda]|uniref:F-box domain-containing protein n=1 Tax=Phlyctema vagabunda TaxID=108571 RepID=A0ABR4PD67_9HELO
MAARARASRRPTRAVVSYAEPDTDEDIGTGSEDLDDNDREEARSSVRVTTRSQRSHSRLHAQASPRTSPRKRPHSNTVIVYDSDASGAPSKSPSKKRKPNKSIPSKATKPNPGLVSVEIPALKKSAGSGIIPPWQSLPYHILVQIFKYATYPLYNETTFQPNISSQWLFNMARECRAFAEPAITVLYASPPLIPMEKAHKLVGLLNADPAPMLFAYRQKVQSLRIDVGQVATYSLSGYGHVDLHKLVKNLPRLLDLEFYHQKDMAPYRSLEETIKWAYPDSLFQALEEINPEHDAVNNDNSLVRTNKSSVTYLRSWRWSSRLAGKDRPIEKLRQIHQTAPFVAIRKLSFVNYQIPVLKKDEADPKHEEVLAGALSVLSKLEHLIFESSTLVNTKLLPLLPSNLRNLELINCWEVISDDFEDFLNTHGSQLRCLTLNHNQSLSLSWLPSLATACPHLQVFRMDFTCYNLHTTYRDGDPLYERLLQPGEVPTWPPTLQILELVEARKWEAEATATFFQSLLNSACDLPHLRQLVLRVGVMNLGWRDRATFRESWEKGLRRVFKRQLISPKQHHTMAEGFSKQLEPSAKEENEDTADSSSTPVRQKQDNKLGNMIDSPGSDMSTVDENAMSPDKPTPNRRSLRRSVRVAQAPKYTEEDTVSEEEATSPPSTPKVSAREVGRKRRIEREIEILRATGEHASAHHESLPSSPSSSPGDGLSESENGQSPYKKGSEAGFIQGMCEIVDIKIDNQRPTEHQATEADFLDSEPEGDDDWNGDDGNKNDAGYAW